MTSLERTPHSLEDVDPLAESERIARRLHDGFIQSLDSVGMQLRAARRMADDPEAVSVRVAAAADEVDRIARQLRSYVFVLKPGLISGWELERELRCLAGQLAAGKDVSMAVEVDSLAASAVAARSRTQDVAAAREAVANTLRHSRSKKVGLTLFLVNGAAMLEIRGEGDELDPDTFVGHGHEFSDLRAHARALSAGLEVESRRGDGTRVRVRIPVEDEVREGPVRNGNGRGIRVVIVDDHEIVREGLRALIGLAGDIEVCGEAGSIAEALRVTEWTQPDVVVTDVHLSDGSGIEATRALRAHHPSTRVLVLASLGDDEALFSSIMAGAAGFVLKRFARLPWRRIGGAENDRWQNPVQPPADAARMAARSCSACAD